MSLYVGLDGGGTRTRVVVIDDRGQERSRSDGPPSLVPGSQPESVASVIASTVLDALNGADAERVEALCCALAGAGRAEERQRLLAALSDVGLAATVQITSDAEAALVDAFDERPGVVLIAGTGSIAIGRDATGAVVRVGGWGDLMGDEGSGFALGKGALRAVARAADGRGPATALSTAVLRAAAAEQASDLIRWAAVAAKGDIARLAPVVCEVAGGGDRVADDLVKGAVRDLVDHVTAIVPRLRLDPSAAVDVALSGGLLRGDSLMRTRLALRLPALGVRVVERSVDAARGAARIAGAPI